MILYLVRHGTTLANEKKELLGQKDESLSIKGYQEIINLQKEIKNINFTICFTSPYKRTKETAAILCKDQCSIIVDDRLRERDFGLIEVNHDSSKYTSDYWDYHLNKKDYEVETIQDLLSRTREFLLFLQKNYANQTVLVISHAATIRALHFNIVGYNSKTNFLSFKVPNACLYKYIL